MIYMMSATHRITATATATITMYLHIPVCCAAKVRDTQGPHATAATACGLGPRPQSKCVEVTCGIEGACTALVHVCVLSHNVCDDVPYQDTWVSWSLYHVIPLEIQLQPIDQQRCLYWPLSYLHISTFSTPYLQWCQPACPRLERCVAQAGMP